MNIMKRFTDWYRGNNDIEKEPPRSGPKRVGYIIVNYPGKLIAANLLFLLCSVPVITIPAALSALNCYIGRIFRIGYGAEYSDFLKEYRHGLVRYLPHGILAGGVGFYAYYLLSLANNFPQGGQREIVTGIGAGVAIIAALLFAYVFVLTSMVDLPFRHIFKNAAILILLEWKRSVIVVCDAALFIGAALLFFPHSVFWLLAAGFSVHQLVVCAAVCPAVLKRIVEPFEKNAQ